jgi:hypothetical protein
LGIGCPVIVRGKVLMQRIHHLSWNEEIPEKERKSLALWFEDLRNLDGIEIDRCLTPPTAMVDRSW